jgi:membrane protease YdiL (CAAX protease family)
MLICWGALIFLSINGITIKNVPILFIPYIIGGFSPTIASLIAFKKNNVKFMVWLKSIFDFKHNLVSYLLIIIFEIAAYLPQGIISGYNNTNIPFFAIILLIPQSLVGGGLEEAGWRNILQPELENKFSFTISTLIVATIWWVWHLPLFFIEGVSQFGTSYLNFGIMVFGLSFALASIKKNTNSVWLCVLFHCIFNALFEIFLLNDKIYDKILTTAILIILSYIVIGIQKKKLIFK